MVEADMLAVALVASAPAAAGVAPKAVAVVVGAAVDVEAGAAVFAPNRPEEAGAVVDAGAAVVVVAPPPKRLGVAAVDAGAAAEVVGGAPKRDLLAAGAGEGAAADVVAGAEVVVAENKEGFEAGAGAAAGVEPRLEKRPPAAGAEVAAVVVLAGAVVAAGLLPKREGTLEPPAAAGSAVLGVDDAPVALPNRLGVEAGAVLPPVATLLNRPPGFCADAVADAPAPKRFAEGVLAAGCEEEAALAPPNRLPPAAGLAALPNNEADFDSAWPVGC